MKTMTFQEAEKKFLKIAGGKYNTIAYELTTHCDGKRHPKCSIYIDDEQYYIGRTWEEAFAERERALKIPVPEETMLAQQPDACEVK